MLFKSKSQTIVAHATLFITLILVLGVLPTGVLAQEGISVTTIARLNLRSGPGTGFSPIGAVPQDTSVPAIGRNSDSSWVQVNYNGMVGWVSTAYLTPSSSLDALAVVADDSAPAVEASPPESSQPQASQCLRAQSLPQPEERSTFAQARLHALIS